MTRTEPVAVSRPFALRAMLTASLVSLGISLLWRWWTVRR
jgi:hypothetical protein